MVVLEAQRRPGGRVLTLREPFSDGLYAEAGAGRIPETHNLTLHYVKLFGLELEPFYPPPERGKQVLYVGGKRFPYAKLEDDRHEGGHAGPHARGTASSASPAWTQTYVANRSTGSATSKLRAGRRRRSPGSTA